ncbi:hypothetical protein CRUP_015130 [Coryphaenoides rupestris]|nr:hypothetical protein CRUP_015130 [Coryphaenoides rupestris]
MARLQRLPAPQRDQPQELPAGSEHLGQRPLPGPLGAMSATVEEEEEEEQGVGAERHGTKRSWQWALAEVFGTRWKLLWLIPLRSRQPLQASHAFHNQV